MMRPAYLMILGLSYAIGAAAQGPALVNPDAAAINDFNRRVADYVKLHKTAQSEIHRLKPTNSPAAIQEHEHRLAHRIREARRGVLQGNIFAPAIAAEFRRLIGIAMQGPEAARIRASLRSAAPVHIGPIHVNRTYPAELPLQSSPPSLLLNLPPLPPELDYRFVGRDLILRDTEANLVVDFIPNAIP
jgi:hypothetical protein